MDNSAKTNSGGLAVHSGTSYQNRVAAWFCVQMLAEQEAVPMWQWPADTLIEFVRCETGKPIDDVMVGGSHQGIAYINAKLSPTASQSKKSDLASALAQFTRQYISNVNQITGRDSGERTPNRVLDRFVLIISSGSSNSITKIFPRVLTRLRPDLPSQKLSLDDAAQTAKEREILSKVKTHLQREWMDAAKTAPTETEIINLLRLVHVEVLDVDEDGINEREAKRILRASILRNPEQADLVWNTLLKICTLWSSDRNGGSRSDVEQQLLQAGIALKSPRSFQEDIERLKKYSERTFELLRPLSQIDINGQVIKMQRPVSLALRQVAEHESLVVVGEPGSGKSGVLHDLVEQEKNNRDVIFLAVDKLDVQSLGDLQNSLRLEHDFIEVLCNWTGIQSGFLVIDALDAARSGVTAQTFYDLLALINEKAKHWRVIVSIRQYDLRHNTNLKSLFHGQPPNEFRSNEFLFIRHLNIPRLNTEEWLQLASQSPQLGQLFVKADPKLRELLHIPFNVQLMAKLLERGILIKQLTRIKTQIELLNLYWEERVDQPIEEKDAREILLSRAIEEMVKIRSLQVNRRQVATSTTHGTVLTNLLKANVLSEWSDDTGRIDNRIITFSHHVLFDYAVARLMLRDAPQSLVSLLKDDPDLNVAIRPSLIMHFEHEWMCDRNGFWQLVFSIINTLETPEIGKLIGPAVAVEAATDIDDFLPLIEALRSPQQSKRECAEKVYRHVIGALLAKDK